MKGSGNGWRSRGCCRLYLLFETNHINLHIAFFPHFVSHSFSEGLNEAGKSKVESQKEEYTELGVPEEWIPVLQDLGYTTVEQLKEIENV
ncbi:hypothetical protein ES705_15027 [subsurface metagenome]